MDGLTVSEIFENAALVIERQGWTQGREALRGECDPKKPVCLHVATTVVWNEAGQPGHGLDVAALVGNFRTAHDLLDAAGFTVEWNDHPDRTTEQVLAALRQLAAEHRG